MHGAPLPDPIPIVVRADPWDLLALPAALWGLYLVSGWPTHEQIGRAFDPGSCSGVAATIQASTEPIFTQQRT